MKTSEHSLVENLINESNQENYLDAFECGIHACNVEMELF